MNIALRDQYDSQIIELYEFYSIRQISRKLHLSYGFVWERLHENKVKMRPPSKGVRGFTDKLDEKTIKRSVFLYEKLGMTADQIGEYEGCTRQTVVNRLGIGGAIVRPRSAKGRFSSEEFQKLMETKKAA